MPPEVWDHIIDFLWTDPPALLSCALTCRAWLPTSRLHLRRETVLTIRNATMLNCVADVLCSRRRRRLFELVETLRIVDDPVRPFARSFAFCLHKAALPNLTSIVMENIDWSTPAQEPYYQYFRSLSAFKGVRVVELKRCRFRRAAVIFNVLRAFHKLRPLCVAGLTCVMVRNGICVPAHTAHDGQAIHRALFRLDDGIDEKQGRIHLQFGMTCVVLCSVWMPWSAASSMLYY